jgi:hypothetical protein
MAAKKKPRRAKKPAPVGAEGGGLPTGAKVILLKRARARRR